MSAEAVRQAAHRAASRCARAFRALHSQHPPLGPDSPEAGRLRAALDMHDAGVQMYRQRMRRENPLVSDEEVEGMVRAWLAGPGRSDEPWELGDDS